MSEDKNLEEMVQCWIEKAEDSLKVANDELAAIWEGWLRILEKIGHCKIP